MTAQVPEERDTRDLQVLARVTRVPEAGEDARVVALLRAARTLSQPEPG